MKILENAIEVIQIGLEDFKSKDARRAQSALRNIAAGTLLLFKEKLRQLSPPDSEEVLIRQTIQPALDERGQLYFRGNGKKTVDVQQIKDRFKALKITVNWAVLDELNALRNTIEHYYTDKTPAIINEAVSKSFKIINDFCVQYLSEEPIDLFGQDSWNIFLEADEIYRIQKEDSLKSLSQVDWRFSTLEDAICHIRCPSCQSDLIHAVDIKKYEPSGRLPLICKGCRNDFDLEDVIEECIGKELLVASHIAVMDGGHAPYTECPACNSSAYVFSEECCLQCGYIANDTTCVICGSQLDIEEAYDGDICSYHREYLAKSD